MKIFIIATVFAVLSLFETSFGDKDGLLDGLSPISSSSKKVIKLKPIRVVRGGFGGGLGAGLGLGGGRKGGRRRSGRSRGRGSSGVGKLHFSGDRLPLPHPKVLFGSGYGKTRSLKFSDLGLADYSSGSGHGSALKLVSGLGLGGHGNNLGLGGGYGSGLNLGSGHALSGLKLVSVGGGLGGGHGGGYGLGGGLDAELGIQKILKGIDYDSLFDDNSHSSAPLQIGVGDVKGDVYVEDFRDGEVIRCDEYDGGYEYGNGNGDGYGEDGY